MIATLPTLYQLLMRRKLINVLIYYKHTFATCKSFSFLLLNHRFEHCNVKEFLPRVLSRFTWVPTEKSFLKINQRALWSVHSFVLFFPVDVFIIERSKYIWSNLIPYLSHHMFDFRNNYRGILLGFTKMYCINKQWNCKLRYISWWIESY